MTDIPQPNMSAVSMQHTSDAARLRLVKRYRSEFRFKAFGIGAVALAIGFLVALLVTVVGQGLPAFTFHYLNLPVEVTAEKIDANDIGKTDFNILVREALADQLPFASGRKDRRVRNGLVSGGAGVLLRREVIDDPAMIGAGEPVAVLLSDVADLYLKGLITRKDTRAGTGTATPEEADSDVILRSTSDDFANILATVKAELADTAGKRRAEIEARGRSVHKLESGIAELDGQIAAAPADARGSLEERRTARESDLDALKTQIASIVQEAERLEARAAAVDGREPMTDALPSYLIRINGGVLKVTSVEATRISGEAYIPMTAQSAAKPGEWSIERIDVPEGLRKFSDKEIAWTEALVEKGLVEQRFNTIFFTSGASREPETAGIWGAVVGSFFTMLVTLLVSFPIGVAAAIYLEEFAPDNRLTRIIEVNINNLAAVPSIVFGLLGLAMFLNVFGLPRSAPVVGGLVLALITLPTIIIASRAALKAVPPSIREAALGIGASRIQAVFHHVLPLAMPGILTGTIIGMAQALGETAPLLMIGMVAFIVDVPGGPFDPATVLPVQIFMWADFPEPAFQQKTSAAIMVLLGFLILMNAIAIVLRKRFERRW